MIELTSVLHSWMAGGHFVHLDGVEMFYRASHRGNQNRRWLVCFHGFPTSSWDWHLLLPHLEETHRVLVFDFPGYGFSGKPVNRDYSLKRQLDVALELMNFLEIRTFDLLAHDMGNSVACELLRRREKGDCSVDLQSLTLLNGGIYMDLHRPVFTQRLLRTPIIGAVTAKLTSWWIFRLQYSRVYADPGQFDEEHYQSQWALLLNNGGRGTLHKIAGYMKERTRMGEHWTGPLHRLDLPIKVIWGRLDPIAVYAIAQKLCANNKNADLTTLDEIGHYPQLEAPEMVAEAFSDFSQRA